MLLGIVEGNAVCTIKHSGTQGLKLLLVQPVNKHLQPLGGLQIAADTIHTGEDDLCVMVRAREASLALPDETFVPIDSALVGIVDELEVRSDDPFNLTLQRDWNPYS